MTIVRPKEPRFRTTMPNPGVPRKDSSKACTPRPNLLLDDSLIRLAPSTPETKIAYDRNVQTCTFLNLPAEIRSRIYQFALGNIHVAIRIESKSDPVHQKDAMIPKEPAIRDMFDLYYLSWDLTSEPTTSAGHVIMQIGKEYCQLPSDRHRLTLPARTCRQMYADTALLHFELNEFSFYNDAVMREWMHPLNAAQKGAVRKIVSLVGEDMCPSLSKQLTGLQQVMIVAEWMDIQDYLKYRDQRLNDCRSWVNEDPVTEGDSTPLSTS